MLGIDELLVFKVERAADRRRRLASEQHPAGAERNLAAADSLTRIARGLQALEGSALHQRVDELLTDPRYLERPFDAIIRQATNAVGFQGQPESADEFLRELIHHLENEVSLAEDSGDVEAVGLGGIGSLSAHGEVSNPPSPLLAAVLRPTWPQEKSDFLHAMREGKNLYDELHAIFGGAKREREPGDNRAVDRDDLLAQVNANRDLMASTAEVMQTELSQETPDARRVRLGGNVFATLREGAKSMRRFFAEGLFRELGRDAATRVPALVNIPRQSRGL